MKLTQILELSSKSRKNWCIDIKITPDPWYNKNTTIQTIQKRGADLIIHQMIQNENTQNQLSDAIKELQIGKLLRKATITKPYGSVYRAVFWFIDRYHSLYQK